MNTTPVPLTELPIPDLNSEQLAGFSAESIHAVELQQFDGVQALQRLKALEGTRVLAADFGGDKGVTKLFVIQDGRFVLSDEYEDYVQGDKGAGYLQSLEKTAAFASAQNIPIGVSWGGPLNGSKPLDHPKLAVFIAEIQQKYAGDFAILLPTLAACVNDSPAGLIAATIHANRDTKTNDVLFPINGGGLGMAVLTDGSIYATEAGHVQGIKALNTYNQTDACGVFGAEYICIERFGSNKGGIEAQWQAITGEYMRARNIEDRYKEGDELARDLYNNSALIVAHMIVGTAKACAIDLNAATTTVACHGGAFKFPSYLDRIDQILTKHGIAARLVLTSSFVPEGSNACLDGAAYAALLA
jgi:predicted NBD/HSP70 family sugar kinase